MVEPREISIAPNIEIFDHRTPVCTKHSFFDTINSDEEKIICNQDYKNNVKKIFHTIF